jgi:hypothetical protein
MKSVFATLIVSSLFVATSAPASDTRTADFRVGGVAFSMQIPDGYCLPSGKMADIAQLLAAGDTVNTTDLMLTRCDGEVLKWANDYTFVKTPSTALLATVDRATLLTQLGLAFGKTLDTKSWRDTAAKSMSDITGTKIDISGTFAPRGKDDMCGYMAGVLHYDTPGISYDQPIAVCITAIGGRVLSIFRTGTKSDEAGILSLMRETRALAQTIKPIKPS